MKISKSTSERYLKFHNYQEQFGGVRIKGDLERQTYGPTITDTLRAKVQYKGHSKRVQRRSNYNSTLEGYSRRKGHAHIKGTLER